MSGVYLSFFVVGQINNNNCYTLCYRAKYGKNLDIYKQRAKSFWGFAVAQQTTRPQDNKPATAPLVVSLTSCLVVWRSQAKLNFR